MNKAYFTGNRNRMYQMMTPGCLAVFFSGYELRKTIDEYYPFFAPRNFVYLTGIEQKNTVFLAGVDAAGSYWERLYILPPDAMAERWTGRRLKPADAEAISGISDIRYVQQFEEDFTQLAHSGNYGSIYLDLYRQSPEDADTPAHSFRNRLQSNFPHLAIEDANPILRKLRTVKQPCEIEALRKAEAITKDGILAMMKASRPGMYEYQYKAEFDRALGQYGPQGPGFPPIISAGSNNFCIHYYSYTGQAMDGDMILNDVGAKWNHMINDVSRGFPCNGRFTDKQKLLYNSALQTSDYMFSIIRPGMKMADVDKTIREYNAQLLKDAGVLDDVVNVGKYMWHGGAHHIGYDVHDAIEMPEVITPNMTFCVDVGIYHEEWGIGFRVEDNCLVTETGYENLSAGIPRTIEEIEDIMK